MEIMRSAIPNRSFLSMDFPVAPSPEPFSMKQFYIRLMETSHG